MKFDNYPKQIDQVPDDGSTYADVVNHCKHYANYVVQGSKTGTVHECTHGINSDLRNAAGVAKNAFYVRNNRAIVLPEPNAWKHQASAYIPDSVRLSRYNLYVVGQNEWDDSPLYLWDEWVAYTNQAYAAIELAKKDENSQTDEVFGTLGFVAYVTGMMMAVEHAARDYGPGYKDTKLDVQLIEFTRWHLREAFNVYFLGRDLFPFKDDEERLLHTLAIDSSWALQRDFLKTKLGFVIPDKFIPNEPVIPDDFNIVGLKLKKGDFKCVGL